jgi:UDP-3-O-[3-hydroxymyristoyl] glucosamine N-acyltransferase
MKIQDLLNVLVEPIFFGNRSKSLADLISFSELREEDSSFLTWCNDKNADGLNLLDYNSVIIVSKKQLKAYPKSKNLIFVDNPRRAFQDILKKFFLKPELEGIHPSAIIHPTAKLGTGCYIGANVVIEENVQIGDSCKILHNSVILANTIIENNVAVGCNNTIGGVGFGYEKNDEGDYDLIPHIGNVIIKQKVEIGNNTCIDRAVLGSTILEENVKVDNHVHIAHGVKVGKNSMVIAHAMIAGSVRIGENAWIAPTASVLNKKTIGDDAVIGLGAVVIKDVQKGEIVIGNPAKALKKK